MDVTVTFFSATFGQALGPIFLGVRAWPLHLLRTNSLLYTYIQQGVRLFVRLAPYIRPTYCTLSE